MKIAVNDDLIAKAQKLFKNKTPKEIIDDALKLRIAMESQKKLLDYWGKIQLDETAFQ